MAVKALRDRRRVVRIGAGFAMVIALCEPLGATAHADVGGGGDATGDTTPITDCHPDITGFAADYAQTSISVTSGVACTSNPNTDPQWTQGVTEADWGFDTNGDNQLDYIAGVVNVNGFRGGVVSTANTSQLVCTATPLWDGDKTFGATFDPACIGAPPSIRVQAFMVWDETSGGACQCPYDLAPNGDGMTGDIARSSGPPPALGYHTACDRTDSAPGAFADAGLAADCMKAWGIALGKEDGSFGENDSLRRSQVSSLLARLLTTNGVSLTTRRTFPDVNADTVPNSQVRDEIEHLAGAGIIAGFPDGTFGPGGTLTVAQAATFVIRTLHLLHAQLSAGPALDDQGTTTANFDYAIAQAILDPNAKNLGGSTYPSGSSDATMRGLLADMLAQSLEKFGKKYYADCTEAQAAGVAPMQQGSSGYRPALDPDNDGLAC